MKKQVEHHAREDDAFLCIRQSDMSFSSDNLFRDGLRKA